MKKLLIFALCFCSLAWSQNTSAKEAEGPALTIYNQNFFVAREYLPLDLTAGVNHVNFAGITSHLEPDSVILRDLPDARCRFSSRITGMIRCRRNCFSRCYEGKTIDFLIQRGGKEEAIKGKIIRSGYVPSSPSERISPAWMGQPIIEIEGVLRFGLPGRRSFRRSVATLS